MKIEIYMLLPLIGSLQLLYLYLTY